MKKKQYIFPTAEVMYLSTSTVMAFTDPSFDTPYEVGSTAPTPRSAEPF